MAEKIRKGKRTDMDQSSEARSSLSAETDPKMLARVIGANLKYLRKQKFPGWGGQKRFADFLKVNPNDLCVYEYGRSAPNEQRLEDFAKLLDLRPDDLRSPLPGVKVLPADKGGAPMAAVEHVWRDRVDSLKQMVAKLEGKLEVMEDQNQRLEEQVAKLREANFVFRSLLYTDDTDEAEQRRKRVLERLDSSIARLMGHPEEF